MNFNTSTLQTGTFSSVDIIVRQSSDRDPITGLMKYSVHTSEQIQARTETIYGQWKSHEVDLVPDAIVVITNRMGISRLELGEIGTKYTDLLRAIVEYSRNPPTQSELEALGLAEPIPPLRPFNQA